MSCPKCVEGFFLPGEPEGSINTEFMGAYHSPGPASSKTTSHTIILLSDGFGLPMKNCKILADNLSKRLECDVWVPDYFNGTNRNMSNSFAFGTTQNWTIFRTSFDSRQQPLGA